MPASLGPGLRTVSGAFGHSSMFATGSVGREEFFASIDTQFSPVSAARRRGCARRVFGPWHRPHNTATFREGSRGVPYFPITATAVDHYYQRKFLFYSEFQSRSRRARWLWKGPEFGAVWSLREWHKNAPKHCHLLPLFRCRLACSLLSRARSTAVPARIALSIAWRGVTDCRLEWAAPTASWRKLLLLGGARPTGQPKIRTVPRRRPLGVTSKMILARKWRPPFARAQGRQKVGRHKHSQPNGLCLEVPLPSRKNGVFWPLKKRHSAPFFGLVQACDCLGDAARTRPSDHTPHELSVGVRGIDRVHRRHSPYNARAHSALCRNRMVGIDQPTAISHCRADHTSIPRAREYANQRNRPL
jgi:hypothetical protein